MEDQLEFSVAYRNLAEDFALVIDAVRHQMNALERVFYFWFPWLCLPLGLIILATNLSLYFVHVEWQIPVFFTLYFAPIAILFWSLTVGIRYLSGKQWKKATTLGYYLRFSGNEESFSVYPAIAEIENMSPNALKKSKLVSLKWESIKGYEMNEEHIILVTFKYRALLISNRDFSGTNSYEEICNIVRSNIESVKPHISSITTPR